MRAFAVGFAVLAGALAVLAAPTVRPEMLRLFDAIDTDHDGIISITEMAKFTESNDMDLTARGLEGLTWKDMVKRFPARMTQVIVEGTDPVQVHTSLLTDSRLAIMWVTGEDTATSTVQYGLNSTDLVNEVTGDTHTYTAGGWKGVIHEVHMPEIPPNTVVHYHVGDTNGGWSAIFAVTTPPVPGTANGVQVFGAFGDMGTAIPLGYKVCEQMEADHNVTAFNLLVHIGDLAYASTAMSAEDNGGEEPITDHEDEFIWDIWGEQVEPLAANIPYMTTVGNHEKFFNYSSYLARFRNPAPWGGSPDQIENATFWFSFDYGLVHFVSMSTEHDYNPGSPQYEWLQQDLAAANANKNNIPWIILTGHRPMYCSDKDELDSHEPGAPFQTTIQPLMVQYGVDLYLCGHMHMYERIHPVLNNVTLQTGNVYRSPQAPPQVVQGTAGVFEDVSFVEPAPEWSAKRASNIGYGRFFVYNATHLFYEFLQLDDGKRHDSFWLIN